jgi:hypothetical protein
MSLMKARYAPDILYSERKTAFGTTVVDCPNLYEELVENGKITGTIVRVDCLSVLIKSFNLDKEDRTDLYNLISGDCNDSEFRSSITNLYGKSNKFQEYVTEQLSTMTSSVTMVTAIVAPMLEVKSNTEKEIKSIISDTGGNYLYMTHEYVYARYCKYSVPDFKGKEVTTL